MNDILTQDKLLEIQKLMSPRYPAKEAFFQKFLPNIKDITTWVIVVPITDEPRILEFVENNEWVYMDRYATTMFALNNNSWPLCHTRR